MTLGGLGAEDSFLKSTPTTPNWSPIYQSNTPISAYNPPIPDVLLLTPNPTPPDFSLRPPIR
ncbi:hypothetical protein EV648_109203 [Kribbella sp. VKM Ac-2568]|nr:hypothetical protein EV648_109203 [Kribbella sp. VKM Ac-2568]